MTLLIWKDKHKSIKRWTRLARQLLPQKSNCRATFSGSTRLIKHLRGKSDWCITNPDMNDPGNGDDNVELTAVWREIWPRVVDDRPQRALGERVAIPDVFITQSGSVVGFCKFSYLSIVRRCAVSVPALMCREYLNNITLLWSLEKIVQGKKGEPPMDRPGLVSAVPNPSIHCKNNGKVSMMEELDE